MSSKGRGSTTIDQDKYYTPRVCIVSLLPLINFKRDMTFLEPCEGTGVITRTVQSYTDIMLGYPVTTTTYELDREEDYLLVPKPSKKYDLCITNPPYSLAQEFIEKTLEESSTVIMLLRLNYLASKKRREFFRLNPPNNLIVLSSRPSFVSVCRYCGNSYHNDVMMCCNRNLTKTTDSTDYAWFCWGDKDVLPDRHLIWI